MSKHLLFACLLACGLFLIYRGTLSDDELTRVRGKVERISVESVSSKKGSDRYALTFALADRSDKLGIFTGTSSRLSEDSPLHQITSGNIYTFYFDPTVLAANGTQLGVRKIEQGQHVLFKENNNKQLFPGIIVSVMILFSWLSYARRS